MPAQNVHVVPAGMRTLNREYRVDRRISQRPVRELINTSVPAVAVACWVSRNEQEPYSVAASVTGRKPLTKMRWPSVPCSALSSVASRFVPVKKPCLWLESNWAIWGWTEDA
jgi:hypothetical protein